MDEVFTPFAHCGSEPSSQPRGARLVVVGGAFQDLLNMNFDLPQKGWCDCEAVTFVSQDRHAALNTDRFKDCFGDAERQAIEWTDDDDTIVAFSSRLETFADSRNGFTIDLR